MAKVKIEVSARHLHISQKDLEKLFGRGYELKPLKSLSQTGEFAASEMVTLKTKDGQIDHLRIIGPVRAKTQVELAITDARKLKLDPPIRLSGDLAGSAGGTLIGPKGKAILKEGIIIAKRHIHCDTITAKKLGLKETKPVKVRVTGVRSAVLENIPVRIKDNYVFRLHLDTDEANAVLGGNTNGEIIK